jgi:hypothetical protein
MCVNVDACSAFSVTPGKRWKNVSLKAWNPPSPRAKRNLRAAKGARIKTHRAAVFIRAITKHAHRVLSVSRRVVTIKIASKNVRRAKNSMSAHHGVTSPRVAIVRSAENVPALVNGAIAAHVRIVANIARAKSVHRSVNTTTAANVPHRRNTRNAHSAQNVASALSARHGLNVHHVQNARNVRISHRAVSAATVMALANGKDVVVRAQNVRSMAIVHSVASAIPMHANRAANTHHVRISRAATSRV